MEHGGLVVLGIVIGIAAAAPVGPVNVMTLQRALRYGFVPGLCAGAGSALADIIFATVAAFGITAVRTFIDDHAGGIQIVGGIIVILFGIRILASHPTLGTMEDTPNGGSVLSGAATGFAMTITNPGAVLGFIALFGALGDWAPEHGDFVGAAELVAGVAIGASLWWISLAALVTRFRDSLTERTLERMNWIAGGIMTGFGVVILGRLILVKTGVIS